MTFIIEKGIPIPRQTHAEKIHFPLDDMENGDSFTAEISLAIRLRTALVLNNRKTKKIFTTRQVGELIRVWRIA